MAAPRADDAGRPVALATALASAGRRGAAFAAHRAAPQQDDCEAPCREAPLAFERPMTMRAAPNPNASHQDQTRPAVLFVVPWGPDAAGGG
jgi:hypothetical protein